jgi:vitamin K-dependent gamma-carboxylase
MKTILESFQARATRRVDISSLAAFRVLFGLMMFVGTLRFMYFGWVEQFFVEPDYYFSYWGFEWVGVLPPAWMYAAFVALAVASLLVALGLFYRVAIVAFFLLFTYVELIDVANYLNHYYLVSLLAFLLCFLPANRAWSLDAWLRPKIRRETVSAYVIYLLRCQVFVVYFYAGVAKLGGDWLMHGQPLNIWLSSRVDAPLVGPILDYWWVAVAMSWGGLLNDLLVPFLLLWKKSRPWAYATVVVFHLVTGWFFRIGMFPLIMIVSATIFFSPGWPRWLFAKLRSLVRQEEPERRPVAPVEVSRSDTKAGHPSPIWRRIALGAAVVYCAFQLLMPLRSLAYPGNVLWHEQGMRWSWKVMVRAKNGSVTYLVDTAERDRPIYVSPSRYLTSHQEREMSGQPDLILQLAHHIGREYQAEGFSDVEVRADNWVSLNGRPPQPMIDPDVDLMTVDDGVGRADWILPGPTDDPIRLRSYAHSDGG